MRGQSGHFFLLVRAVLTSPKWFGILLVSALLISACSPLTTTPAIPSSTLPVVNTPSQTSQPTTTPSPTPPALTFWADPATPGDLLNRITLPAGAVWVDDLAQATFSLQPLESIRSSATIISQTHWVYALAAPFLTVRDDVSRDDLKAAVRGQASTSSPAPFTELLVRQSDQATVYSLLGIDLPADAVVRARAVSDDQFDVPPDPENPAWAILPFDQLSPGWKVISLDGVSPLDENFSADSYPLSRQFALSAAPSTVASLATELSTQLSALLPAANRDPNQLTSLVMTGVTAMVRQTAYNMEKDGVTSPATGIRDLLQSADLTHISNEVSFYEGCPEPNPNYEGYSFCSSPSYLNLLEYVGADIIELTGNHNNDSRAFYHVDAVPYTLNLYKQQGMQWYAGGVNLEEAKKPLLVEHHGNKLAFIGCNSYGPPMAWATEASSGSAPCEDFGWIADSIQSLASQGYLPIVTFQYQEDYDTGLLSGAQANFRRMVDAGAIIVNGSQSHVAKVMEIYQGALIDYGLGNLFFDQPGIYSTYRSIVQRHFFYAGKYISTELDTIILQQTSRLRPMTAKEREVFLTDLFSASEGLWRKK